VSRGCNHPLSEGIKIARFHFAKSFGSFAEKEQKKKSLARAFDSFLGRKE